MGQFTQAEPVHAWNKLCPLLRGNAFLFISLPVVEGYHPEITALWMVKMNF